MRVSVLTLLLGLGAGTAAPAQPQPLDPQWSQCGEASWYGNPFHGRETSSGEIYDMNAPTAAHPSLPFNTWVNVRDRESGRTTRVRINDRGPFVRGRVIDLSRAAATELGMLDRGVAAVELTIAAGPPSPRLAVSDPDPAAGDAAPPPTAAFTVQVGAFSDLANAVALSEKLRQSYAGVDVTSESAMLNRVTVGRDLDRAAAEELVRRLADDGYAAIVKATTAH